MIDAIDIASYADDNIRYSIGKKQYEIKTLEKTFTKDIIQTFQMVV